MNKVLASATGGAFLALVLVGTTDAAVPIELSTATYLVGSFFGALFGGWVAWQSVRANR